MCIYSLSEPQFSHLQNGGLSREFPGGPVVGTLHFHCWGPGSIPDWRTKIPQVAWCGQKKKMGVIISSPNTPVLW